MLTGRRESVCFKKQVRMKKLDIHQIQTLYPLSE